MDGETTSRSSGVQEAIESAHEAGGGVVEILPGTQDLQLDATVVLRSGVNLIGNNVRLRFGPNVRGALSTDGSQVYYRTEIRGILIDAGFPSQGTVVSIVSAQRCRIDITVENVGARAVAFRIAGVGGLAGGEGGWGSQCRGNSFSLRGTKICHGLVIQGADVHSCVTDNDFDEVSLNGTGVAANVGFIGVEVAQFGDNNIFHHVYTLIPETAGPDSVQFAFNTSGGPTNVNKNVVLKSSLDANRPLPPSNFSVLRMGGNTSMNVFMMVQYSNQSPARVLSYQPSDTFYLFDASGAVIYRKGIRVVDQP